MSYWKDFFDRYVDGLPDDNRFRQVGRTLNSQPMSESMFRGAIAHSVSQLEIEPGHVVLDLCCGNGLFSIELGKRCRSVIAVDFNYKLIQAIPLADSANVVGITSDVLEIDFRRRSFDRVLLAAALQHFSQSQAIRLFGKMAAWLKPGGILLVTDILDARRIWNFFDSTEREDVYFCNVEQETPILGTWFDRPWLEKLAHKAGFSHTTALDQPESYWYSHYRFDLVCRKQSMTEPAQASPTPGPR